MTVLCSSLLFKSTHPFSVTLPPLLKKHFITLFVFFEKVRPPPCYTLKGGRVRSLTGKVMFVAIYTIDLYILHTMEYFADYNCDFVLKGCVKWIILKGCVKWI
jgi:cytochrome c oxidase subunit IV